jgi:ATP-dependent exoDNAse (exonuclease V) alpha subunit
MNTLELLKKYINDGENVFLTGQGGTGKTYHIEQLVKDEPNSFSITSTTGITAIAIGGRTIHSFAGILGGSEGSERRLNHCKRLIIDEVSMFSAKEFENFDLICRAIKDHKLPFGGIQLLVSGDLFQLGPVNGEFFIKSMAYFKARFKIINLTEIKRQSNLDMINALNDIRKGVFSKRAEEFFKDQKSCVENPVKLMAKNSTIDKLNSESIINIKKPVHTLKASIKGNSKTLMREILNGLLCPYALSLKVGCRVMLTENARVYPHQEDEQPEYVNGDIGTLIGYYVNEGKRIVKDTIHEYKLKIPNESSDEEFFHEHIIYGEKRKSLQLIIKLDRGPLVYVPKHSWELGNCPDKKNRADPNFSDPKFSAWCEVSQFPVKLSYGITMHKSQGMSLDYVEVVPHGSFTGGMVYTGLSRAKTPEGLGVIGLKKEHVFAHPDAVKFYQSLEQ